MKKVMDEDIVIAFFKRRLNPNRVKYLEKPPRASHISSLTVGFVNLISFIFASSALMNDPFWITQRNRKKNKKDDFGLGIDLCIGQQTPPQSVFNLRLTSTFNFPCSSRFDLNSPHVTS
jgi:hypothetical protein